jgi:hypothetical protein
MVELNFDANEVEPLGSFEPLPVGEYVVVIESTEMKDASTGRGQYLQLVYNVIDGDFKGRKLFDRLNLVNESTQAQEIAQRALSSICRAVSVMHPQNSEELHDKPFIVKVAIRPAKGEYQASNVVREYKPLETECAPAAAPAAKKSPVMGKPAAKKEEAAAPAAAAAPAKGKKPWEKK